jgi:N-acetylglucosaminyldiphosphoundecaprenol N-acetyl-beta-D-mannosaminyltransferase
VKVWGLPLAPLTLAQTVDEVERLIHAGQPGYFITANVHYAMLAERDGSLSSVNDEAAFLVADGMPLVWASRWKGRALPERVTGADLFPALCDRAAARGYRVFLLGGAPGVGEEATRRLRDRFEGLNVVGVESPPFRPLSPVEQRELAERIRAARPDILFLCFSMPNGERWLAEWYPTLGVPACVNIGASLDFMAGRVPRAPRWVQRLGLEWVYRLYQEPARLLRRYVANGVFVLRMLAWDAVTFGRGRAAGLEQDG